MKKIAEREYLTKYVIVSWQCVCVWNAELCCREIVKGIMIRHSFSFM